MKRSRVQFLTMLVGSLLAMIIVCSQFFVLGQKSQETALVSESSEESSEETPVFALPSFSIPTPVQFHLDIDLHFLFDIGSEEEDNRPFAFVEVFRPEKFFTTLFRFIISPNAP